jgi:preprotein translocase subunit SecE
MQEFTFTAPDFGKNPAEFLKEVRAELLKVAWPKREEIVKLTGVVLGVSCVVAAYLGGLDFVFTKLVELLLKTLK